MNKKEYTEEVDSCAIIGMINKNAIPTHSNIIRVIEGLKLMGHRSGEINGEGDGCGITTDIPRELWSEKLSATGYVPSLAQDDRFFVGHFFIHHTLRGNHKSLKERRKLVKVHVRLKGKVLRAFFSVAERKHLAHSVLIGQNVLKLGKFLIDPLK